MISKTIFCSPKHFDEELAKWDRNTTYNSDSLTIIHQGNIHYLTYSEPYRSDPDGDDMDDHD